MVAGFRRLRAKCPLNGGSQRKVIQRWSTEGLYKPLSRPCRILVRPGVPFDPFPTAKGKVDTATNKLRNQVSGHALGS